VSVREKTRVYMSDGSARGGVPPTPARGGSPESAGERKATEKQKKYILTLIPKVLEKYQQALEVAEEYRRQGMSLLPSLARDEMIAKITLKIAEMLEKDELDLDMASRAIEFLKDPHRSLLGGYEIWLRLVRE